MFLENAQDKDPAPGLCDCEAYNDWMIDDWVGAPAPAG